MSPSVVCSVEGTRVSILSRSVFDYYYYLVTVRPGVGTVLIVDLSSLCREVFRLLNNNLTRSIIFNRSNIKYIWIGSNQKTFLFLLVSEFK